MSNNFLNHQQNGNISPHNGNASHSPNGSTRTGSLLRDYRQQQQQGPQQYSPAPMPPTQASPSYPPQTLPAQPPQRQPQGWPSPQSWPTGNRQDGQGWVANTMQMVRRWSGRVAAVAPPVDPHPLVLYRPGAPLPATEKRRPWKRSRTVRIAMQMKHRRARWQQKRPRTQAIVSGILIALLLLLLIGASSGSAYAYKYYQDQLPQLQSLANQFHRPRVSMIAMESCCSMPMPVVDGELLCPMTIYRKS